MQTIRKTTVDFDLHGVVGVRLLHPTEGDLRAVIKQIGPPTGVLREPDITLRFVPELKTAPLHLLGLEAGHDQENLYLLRSSKAPCKIRIPFDELGRPCEVLCQSGMRSVPLLIAIINLAFLGKNHLPLHASAFHYRGVCSAVMGWAKGGKTEAMLAFARHGASYIADEWTIFSADGDEVFGIPEPVRLWDWQLAQLPRLMKAVSTRKKWIFKSVHAMDSLYRALCAAGLKKTFPVPILGEAIPAFKRQLNVQLPPAVIFENRCIARAQPQSIFLIGSHDRPETTVTPCDPGDVARRMHSSNVFEQFPLLAHYRAFRFAFPGRQNPLLENIEEIQSERIDRLFNGKNCYQVRHPYPVDFEDLYRAMRPYLKKTNEAVAVSPL